MVSATVIYLYMVLLRNSEMQTWEPHFLAKRDEDYESDMCYGHDDGSAGGSGRTTPCRWNRAMRSATKDGMGGI